jgi:O-antigen/teichoic acid export membrane protein
MSAALNQKVRSAYKWTIAGTITKYMLGFGLSMLLARLLEPKDYGIIGMVLAITGLLSVVQDLGLGQAVIYFRDDEAALPAYFSVTVAMGLLFTAATFLSAPLIAWFYGTPVLIPIVQALSFTLLLSSLRSVSQGVILKRFQFREMTLIETFCGLGSSGIAVVMAWRGFGVWSLVTNLLLKAALPLFFLFAMVRPRFALRVDIAVLRRLLGWGLPLTGSSLLWKFYTNADYLVIGKLLGTQLLGYYTLAFRIATLVDEKIVAIVSRVSFPTFSELREKREEMVAHWHSVTHRLAFINFPILTGIAINSRDLVAVVLGEKWVPAVEPLRFLCMACFIRTLTPVMTTMIAAIGRTDISFRYSLLNSIVMPLAFIAGCLTAELRGVGIAWMTVMPVTCFYLIRHAARLTGTSISGYLFQLRLPLLVTCACGAAMMAVTTLLSPGFTRLLLSAAAGVTCYLLCLSTQVSFRNRVSSLVIAGRKRLGTAA